MSGSDSEIVRHNFSVRFREWYAEARPNLMNGPPYFVPWHDLIVELLSKAQHFLLPPGGRVLEDSGLLHAKYAPMLHLPFPVTAFEYSVEHFTTDFANTARSTRRIALCVDQSVTKHYPMFPKVDEDEWIVLAIYWADDHQVWVVPAGGAIVSRSKVVNLADMPELADEHKAEISRLVERGLIDAGHLKVAKPGVETISLQYFQPPGAPYFSDILLANDILDESSSAVHGVVSLNCKNVTTTELPPSQALNQKRQKKGKIPFTTYHVLDLVAEEGGTRGLGSQGGSHASPRQHLRRGHLRRLTPDRVTWVRAAVVGSSAAGHVQKDYAVHPKD